MTTASGTAVLGSPGESTGRRGRSPLDCLTSPSSIAIIGASGSAGSISSQPLKHLRACGYKGRVYPVNPVRDEIDGVRCYPSVEALPETPDLAVIVLAARRVPVALAACGARGVPVALVISSGFAEADDAGKQLQRELADVARTYGIRIVGPNCQGVMNIEDGMAAGFGAPFSLRYRKGPVSVVSQSGGFGCGILVMASEEGLGFRHFVTTGNECDLGALDLIEYLVDDPGTQVIAVYIEGLKDGRRLLDVGTKALRAGKPLLVWKGGTSDAGARAVASHTANLTSPARLYRAAFRQMGAIEVNDVPELADIATGLVAGRMPRGLRVAVVTTSGGAGVVMADRYSEAGIQIPSLTEATLDRLKKCLPPFASVGNPIDTTAGVIDGADRLREVLELIASDPNIDCMSLACAQLSGEVATRIAEAVVAVYRRTDKPFFLAWNAPAHLAQDAYALVDAAGVPRFRTPGRCAKALSALCHYAHRRRSVRAPGAAAAGAGPSATREYVVSADGPLAEFEAKRILADFGIPRTRERLARTADEACRLAEEIGYPLVIKVQSRDVPHKTDAGGVELGVANEARLRAAWARIDASVRERVPGARVDGMLLQEQVSDGHEMIVGINNDPVLGPAVVVGAGGIYSEVLDDIAIRFAPVTKADALDMIRELRTYPMLDGARGKPRLDVDALADVVCRVSAVALSLGESLDELDINPLFVLREGLGVRAGDALLKWKGGTA